MSVAPELGVRRSPWEDDIESPLLSGERALFVEGDLRSARKWFEVAHRLAERRSDGVRMARAALGLGGVWVHEHRTAAEAGMVRARQRHALTLIDEHSALALRLRARLCAEEDYRNGEHAAILEIVNEARALGDPIAVAEVLSLAHHCLLGPADGKARLELAEELIGRAPCAGRNGDLLMGLMWRTADLFLAGDLHAERCLRELHAQLTTSNHLAVGFVASAMDVMLSIRAGRFAQAEELAQACAELGTTAGDIDALGWYCEHVGTIRWYQGRVAELVPMLSELINSPTLSAVDNTYFAGLAVAAAAAGDRRLAVGMLARVRGRDLADLPHSSSWLVTMYCVAEAAYLLNDASVASSVSTLLGPYAHLPVISSLGVTCLGSAHHALGVAALTTGDTGRAVEHFRQAVQDNLALGHWPAIALSRWRLGQALTTLHGPQHEPARRELATAHQEAALLGMSFPAPLSPPTQSAGAPDPGHCRRRGRQWQIELNGRTVLVEHSVGMRHLATLIANPGCEIRAIDLAAGPSTSEREIESAQPMLDELAVRTYRQRLAQLQAEIDELETLDEHARALPLRTERDWLAAELSAAAGVGGRTRPFTGNEERARLAVGKAIRRAMDRIAKADPVIGEQLRATVHTGLRCCYRPG